MGTSRVFISYSRRDQPAVSKIASELDQLGQEVWLDQELSGGQRWWDAILERIRACDCFIFALSEAAVTSKACRSELDYASKLGRWIVPVTVGPSVPDQLLPPVLAETQRVPADAPMQLARALLGLPPTPPLPDPLPEPPPVPVSYLDQLSDAVNREHLTVSEQRDLLGSIKQRLRDPEEREAGLALLHRFRQHAEINAWVAEEIDAELAKVEASPAGATGSSPTVEPAPAEPAVPQAGPTTAPTTAPRPTQPSPTQPPPTQPPATTRAPYPPPGGPAYYPPPQTWVPPRPSAPPPPPRRKSRAGWWIAAIVGFLLLLVVGGCVALAVIGSNIEDEFAELREQCGAGDMSACDELFQESPVDSDDEFFGATCGRRTDGSFPGDCEATLGSFVDE
jgi:TIR domain